VATVRDRTHWSATRPQPGAKTLGHVVVQFKIAPPDEDGLIVGECVELGTSSFGETLEEALNATVEATAAYLEALDDSGELERVLKERGVEFHPVAPADDEEQTVPPVYPGETVSVQRLSALAGAR